MNIQKHLSKITIGLLLAWIVAQIIVLGIYWDTPQFSDALRYQERALHCYNNNLWYPDASQIYVDYICYPGYINYLILHLKVFGSFAFVGIFNVLLNVLIVLELFILAKHFFSKTTACISVILFCLLPSNVFMCQPHLTEIPFLATVLGAVCLVRKDKASLVAAGILFFLSHWIRPLTPLFLLPVLLYMYLNRFRIRNYVALLLPVAALVVMVGCYAKSHTGYFTVQATTGGYNLIIGANDDIGHRTCFAEGTLGYIENMDKVTYAERDAIWNVRAMEWIKEHPVKYAAHIPVKIFQMWWHDYHSAWLIYQQDFWDTDQALTWTQKMQYRFKWMGFSVTYYMVILCFVLSLFRFRRQMNKTLCLLFIPLVLGTVMCGLIYGAQRYHYPYMPIIILFAAWWIEEKVKCIDCV